MLQKLIPVLALTAPEAGIEQLCEIFGFQRAGQGRVSYGDLTVAVVSVADVPQDLLPIQMDHLALKVPDLDQVMARIQAPWSAVTPNGPREIAEFWGVGVRFMFYDAPEGAPLEYCTLRDGSIRERGLDHFGLRLADLEPMDLQLRDLGATPVAEHRLGEVNVRFLERAGQIFELFDEPPLLEPREQPAPRLSGWCGFLFDA